MKALRAKYRAAVAACLYLFIGHLPAASAVDLRNLPWHELASRAFNGAGDDPVRIPVQKAWREQQRWDAWPCEGRYHYDMQMALLLDRTDVNLNENGSVDVVAEFRDLSFEGNGTYRSRMTACLPFSGWFGVSADSARVTALAWMVPAGDKEEIRLRINGTQLGTLHFGSAVPAWLERFATARMNSALERLWRSHLGEWISEKVAQELKKVLPKGRGH